jgi:hypothetical protein
VISNIRIILAARNEILDIMKEAVDNCDLTKVKRVPVIKELRVSPQDRVDL